jgi:hypothetical protein
MKHIGYASTLALGLSLLACTLEYRGDDRPTNTESAVTLAEETLAAETLAAETPAAGALEEARAGDSPAADEHHHHDRGRNCPHGLWATTQAHDHHHHMRQGLCSHGVWATTSDNGHHHHERNNECDHNEWATSQVVRQASADHEHFEITEETFSDDPTVQYDLSNADPRSYEEIAAELARMEGAE